MLSLANLSRAWEEVVEKDSSPGSDGVSLEAFARNWEANLIDLREAVRGNRYRPAPLVRFTVPKRDGSPRLLGNLTVRDKVLQRAVLRLLDDIYEGHFLDCSFAYRPGRSVQDAVERIAQARAMGRVWVLDADIDDFFHSLDHQLLLRFLRETITDEQVLALIMAWLKVGRPDPARATGTPLGAVISPLLSNVYLHYLDLVMTGAWPAFGQGAPELAGRPPDPAPTWVYCRYADDFVVLGRTQQQAELAQGQVEETLAALQLRLEPAKTRITTFQQGFDYLGCSFKDDYFSFLHQGSRIKISEDEDWDLFRRYGPEGYE